MSELNHGKCKGCGEPILWAQTQDEKFHPLNVRPTVRYWKDAQDNWRNTAFYQSHFETCPQGPKFKKGKETDGSAK